MIVIAIRSTIAYLGNLNRWEIMKVSVVYEGNMSKVLETHPKVGSTHSATTPYLYLKFTSGNCHCQGVGNISKSIDCM